MRTAEDRERFIDTHRISITWSNDGVSLYWRGQDSPGQPGGFYPISKGLTYAEAVDAAIARWERKHREHWG